MNMQAPRTSNRGALRSGWSFGKDSTTNHWQSIIDCLTTLLSTLKENFVPPIIVQKIFTQIFSYINVQLFNSLLLRRECCTFSNGEYVKSGLAELEQWCYQAKEEIKTLHFGGSLMMFSPLKVIHQKYRISYDEIINDLSHVSSLYLSHPMRSSKRKETRAFDFISAAWVGGWVGGEYVQINFLDILRCSWSTR